jgi:hypothetical protein
MWSLVRRTIERNKPTYGRHLQFKPQVRSADRVESRNARPVTQATATTEDLDRNELSQLVSWLLGLRDPDHGEPTSGRPEWSFRRQLRCGGRWHRRYLSGHGFPRRRLSPLESLRQTFCGTVGQAPLYRFNFLEIRVSHANRCAVLTVPQIVLPRGRTRVRSTEEIFRLVFSNGLELNVVVADTALLTSFVSRKISK